MTWDKCERDEFLAAIGEKQITSFPFDGYPEERQFHAECLALEQAGAIRRVQEHHGHCAFPGSLVLQFVVNAITWQAVKMPTS